jgi:hypothetical protein
MRKISEAKCNFYFWLKSNVFKINEGDRLPCYLIWIKYILFPVSMFFAANKLPFGVKYRIDCDALEIAGQSYTYELFINFGKNFPDGRLFKFNRSEPGNIISIDKVVRLQQQIEDEIRKAFNAGREIDVRYVNQPDLYETCEDYFRIKNPLSHFKSID